VVRVVALAWQGRHIQSSAEDAAHALPGDAVHKGAGKADGRHGLLAMQQRDVDEGAAISRAASWGEGRSKAELSRLVIVELQPIRGEVVTIIDGDFDRHRVQAISIQRQRGHVA
jgi:hypothetical protein